MAMLLSVSESSSLTFLPERSDLIRFEFDNCPCSDRRLSFSCIRSVSRYTIMSTIRTISSFSIPCSPGVWRESSSFSIIRSALVNNASVGPGGGDASESNSSRVRFRFFARACSLAFTYGEITGGMIPFARSKSFGRSQRVWIFTCHSVHKPAFE